MIQHFRRQKHTKNTENNAAAKNHLDALVNSLTDAVMRLNKDGVILAYNAAMLNLLDTNKQLAGAHISDILRLRTTEGEELDVFEELKKMPSIRKRDDIEMQIDEGDVIRLETTFAPIQDEDIDITGYVLILRDITKAKSLEEERDEFISVVSHELRTPVAIAEGALDNAQLLMSRGFNDKSTEAVAEAHRQVIFLAKMINDLSTLSRAERGVGDEPEMIKVAELGQRLHSEYEPQAKEQGLVLNSDIQVGGESILVSQLYLEELLQNFITNAIKYTQEGSITISMKRNGERIIFAVADTGIGMTKSDMKRIFERFYRVEDYRTRETSGTGLGLYVAAKLAKKLNCKIEVKSRINHGSTFWFSLPIAQER